MKKFKLIIMLLACLKLNVSEATTLSTDELLESIFDDESQACFILYDAKNNKQIINYNHPENHCQQRIPPNSTFKIALSLMAFDQQIIKQDTLFKWDGKKRGIAKWNKDQTPQSWEQYSVVWVSQQLTSQLGMNKIKHYLSTFQYGNQDFSGDRGKNNGLSHAWLNSSLKISPEEQLDFLKRMNNFSLAISKSAIQNTKKNLYLGKTANGLALYGKTGSNKRMDGSGLLLDGWFIGYAEDKTQRYIVVTTISDGRGAHHLHQMGQHAKDKAIAILDSLGNQENLITENR